MGHEPSYEILLSPISLQVLQKQPDIALINGPISPLKDSSKYGCLGFNPDCRGQPNPLASYRAFGALRLGVDRGSKKPKSPQYPKI